MFRPLTEFTIGAQRAGEGGKREVGKRRRKGDLDRGRGYQSLKGLSDKL